MSYAWLTDYHPDPDGGYLRRVAKALKALLNDPGAIPFNPGQRYGVFWDYGSLHQHPDPANGVMRTEEQDTLFKQGLEILGTSYSHLHTIVLKLTTFPDNVEDLDMGVNMTAYYDRGWCYTESYWSSLAQASGLSLDLGLMSGEAIGRTQFIEECTQNGGRRPPLLPSQFAAELETKWFNNGKDDKPLAKRLYEAAFDEQFGKATDLFYSNLGWGDAGAAQLAAVLASGAAPRIETLWLDGNQIGDEGCKALAATLEEGIAPLLEKLYLFHNKIGDEGCKALAAALKEGAAPSLKLLVVDNEKPPELVTVCEERGIRLY